MFLMIIVKNKYLTTKNNLLIAFITERTFMKYKENFVTEIANKF